MTISVENFIINGSPENLINRKYRLIRKKRNQIIAYSGVAFGIAAAEAIAQKGLMTILLGGTTLFCLKGVELGTNVLRILRPQYKEIVERAKNINKIRRHINTSI